MIAAGIMPRWWHEIMQDIDAGGHNCCVSNGDGATRAGCAGLHVAGAVDCGIL